VLLNNLLSDLPAMALARDGVDPEMITSPQRWDIAFVRRFMLAFGLLSSCFDALTFVVLAAVLDVGPDAFRTGWFVESLLTEVLVALVVRTRRPFWRSRPSRGLWIGTVIVALVAVLLPYTPVGAWFALTPLALHVQLVLAAITAAYVVAVEAGKRTLLQRLLRRSARAASAGRAHA
jgi:Mg2+-importing ATPase